MTTAERETRGFTLIELIVAVAVIALLAGLIAPALFRNVADAKVAAASRSLAIRGYFYASPPSSEHP